MKSCIVSTVFVFFPVAGENQMLAGKAGAIDAVVAAMRAHIGNARVLKNACGAMCNICGSNGAFAFPCILHLSWDAEGENHVLAVKAGAIDAVLAAMRTHVGDAGVSEQACVAMRNICAVNGVCMVLKSA